MEVASTYIPLDRRQALAQSQTLPEYTTGAALFADISGFTPLTELLARQLGPQRGAEELTRQLESIYTAIIAEVERYHGSVISFSGDAITCWFDGAEVLATRQATTAALAMQQLLRQSVIQPVAGGDRFDLEMKAVIACGPVRRFVVGDPNVQLFDILAGATIDRLALADELTNRGEVVLSSEAARVLSDDLNIVELRRIGDQPNSQPCAVVGALKRWAQPTLWPSLTPAALTDSQTRPWLLPEVYQRLQNVQGDFLAELRQAVAVFLSFGGLDYDADLTAARKLDAFVRWAQQVVNRYEGSLLQLTIGDKGSYLYIAFGAFLTHEDDAARSVAAARVLCQPPADLNFITSIQIGISRGRLRAGPYGSNTYRTYGLIGDDVNLAARLMQTAQPGQIIVSGRIAKAAPGQIWESLQPLALKGRTEPVSAFALVTSQTAPARSWFKPSSNGQRPLIGREAEQAVLVGALDNLEQQQSQTVVIVGEAGIGKSRLVSKILGDTHTAGITKLFGFGDAIEQSTPYHAWRSVFCQLFDCETLSNDSTHSRNQILAQLPPESHDRAALLNAVLPLDWPETETSHLLQGQMRAETIREFLVELLQVAVKRKPTVLVLEDIHWFDSASWALTLAVSRRVQPLVLILVTRPWGERPTAEYQQLIQGPDTRVVTLESLSAENTMALVCGQLGVSALPPVVSQFIQDKAEGHPFFSEELAYALRDTGLIQIDAARGECRVTPNVDLKTIAFPDTVQDVITQRIDRLAPQQQLTLKAASAIGRNFAFRILSEIHPEVSEKPMLVNHLDVLAKLELTTLESTEPELTYFFKHAITHEVAYNLMLFSQRRQLHRAIAEWYERAHADNLTAYYPVLSYHWSKAEHKPKASEYLEKAGQQALAEGAYPEAIKFLGDAQALERDFPVGAGLSESERLRRAVWEFGLGKAYRAVGEMALSRGYLEQAIAVQDRPVPVTQFQKVSGLFGQLGLQLLHLFQPARYLGTASPTERRKLLRAFYTYQELTAIYLLSSEQLLGLYVALRVINISERAGQSLELAMAYGLVGLLSGLVGLHALAERYIHRGQEMAHLPSHAAAITPVLISSALYRCGIGQWLRAKEEITQAIKAVPYYAIDAVGILGAVESYLGNFRTSLAVYAEIYNNRDRHGELAALLALIGQAGGLIFLNQIDEAIQFLTQAIALGVERTTELLSAQGLLAWAYLRQGNLAAAEQSAEAVRFLIAQSSSPFIFSTLVGYRAPAEVYLTLWESGKPLNKEVTENAKQACRSMWTFTRTFPIGEPGAWLFQGRQQWLTGQTKSARSAWQKSLAAARKLNMPYEEAQAWYEIGRHVEGDERDRALTQALQLFEKLETTFDVEQTRALLNSSHV